MDKFTKKLEIFEEVIFPEEMYEDDDFYVDETAAQQLIQEMISSFSSVKNMESLARFFKIIICAVGDFKTCDLYNQITDWGMKLYIQAKSQKSPNQVKIATYLTSWLDHKIEFFEGPEPSKEVRLSVALHADLVLGNNPGAQHHSRRRHYQGYSTYALIVGLADKNYQLINQSIIFQKWALDYESANTSLPYSNIEYIVTLKKRALASKLMAAYNFDNYTYSDCLDEIDLLLQEVAEKFEHIGTDFDREYTKGLQDKFKTYLP